jgi:chitin synthase
LANNTLAMSRQSTGMSHHQRLEAASDLSGLSSISDDLIVSCLRERFMSESIYTNIGTNSLVAVNPHKYVSSNADSVLQKYAAEYRDTSENKSPMSPHIFQLANNAYYHMKRTTQDQSILIRQVTAINTCIASSKIIFAFILAVRLAAENQRTADSP